MKRGYTKSYRKELESDIWMMPPLYHRVFHYLRQKAEWKPTIFPTRKKFGIAVNPGQLITSMGNIAEGVAWYEYGARKVPNRKTIRDVLTWLEGNTMVTVFSNKRGTFIIINNWDVYNVSDNKKVTPGKQPEVTPEKHRPDIPKEVKEFKEKKKKPKTLFVETQIEFRLAQYLFQLIRRNNPTAKAPNFQTWAKHIGYMIRLDHRDPRDIQTVIEWCQQDSFWLANILSTANLREKYDKLWMKMTRGGRGNSRFDLHEHLVQVGREFVEDESI